MSHLVAAGAVTTFDVILAAVGLACAAAVLLIDLGAELNVSCARRAWGSAPYHATRYVAAGVLIALAVKVIT